MSSSVDPPWNDRRITHRYGSWAISIHDPSVGDSAPQTKPEFAVPGGSVRCDQRGGGRGYVMVGERGFMWGNCLVDQCVGVGPLAMMQGGSAISKDLPPFIVACGDNTISGLNTVGLRRAGLGPAERLELKQLYHALFRAGSNLSVALAKAQSEFSSSAAKERLDFGASSKRG